MEEGAHDVRQTDDDIDDALDTIEGELHGLEGDDNAFVDEDDRRGSKILQNVCFALGGPEDPCPTAEAVRTARDFRELLLTVLAEGYVRGSPIEKVIRRSLRIDRFDPEVAEPASPEEALGPIIVEIVQCDELAPGSRAAKIVTDEGGEIDIGTLMNRGVQDMRGGVFYPVLGYAAAPYNVVLGEPEFRGVSDELPGDRKREDQAEDPEGVGHLADSDEDGE
jgi:hypothetical protein